MPAGQASGATLNPARLGVEGVVDLPEPGLGILVAGLPAMSRLRFRACMAFEGGRGCGFRGSCRAFSPGGWGAFFLEPFGRPVTAGAVRLLVPFAAGGGVPCPCRLDGAQK